MHDTEGIEYYRRREAEERASAANATIAGVAKIHLQLADCYARIVQSGGGNTSAANDDPD